MAGTRRATAPWLAKALDKASQAAFGKPAAFMGEGGSIPFMAMLGEKFPKTQFVVTGVLGPHSNAHGPNEFLHIPFAKKIPACIASILADHAAPMSFFISADDDPKRAAPPAAGLYPGRRWLIGAGGQRLYRALHSHLVCRRWSIPPSRRPIGCSRRSGPRSMS